MKNKSIKSHLITAFTYSIVIFALALVGFIRALSSNNLTFIGIVGPVVFTLSIQILIGFMVSMFKSSLWSRPIIQAMLYTLLLMLATTIIALVYTIVHFEKGASKDFGKAAAGLVTVVSPAFMIVSLVAVIKYAKL